MAEPIIFRGLTKYQAHETAKFHIAHGADASSDAVQKKTLANLLVVPPLKNFPEVKSAGAILTIDEVLDVTNPNFASVRKKPIEIERQTKVIPPPAGSN